MKKKEEEEEDKGEAEPEAEGGQEGAATDEQIKEIEVREAEDGETQKNAGNVYNSAEQDDLDLEEGEILSSTRRSSKINNIDYSEELEDSIPEERESQRSSRSRPARNKRRQNLEYEDIDDIDM